MLPFAIIFYECNKSYLAEPNGRYLNIITLSLPKFHTYHFLQRQVPLQGLTAYQTDWSIAALSLQIKGSGIVQTDGSAIKLPVASLEGQPGMPSIPHRRPRCSCNRTSNGSKDTIEQKKGCKTWFS